MVEAGKYENGVVQKSCELLSSQGLLLHSQQCRDATGSIRSECQVRVTGIERRYCMSTEIGRLRGYSFQGTVTVGDG